jgi:adenylate cyclase
MAEVELASLNESFEIPDWIGEEVSDDKRYYNISLLKHPYKQW